MTRTMAPRGSRVQPTPTRVGSERRAHDATSMARPFGGAASVAVAGDPEAAQSEGVRDDRHRAEGHRRGREDGVEEHAVDRVEDAHRDRDEDDVVGEGPEEVLADVAHRGARQGDRVDERPQVAAHEGHARRFHGHVGARAHGDARPSADASAGASLTPSPTIATGPCPRPGGPGRPRPCRRVGPRPRTSSMPTAPRDRRRPSRWLSPVSITTGSPSRWSSATAAAEPGLDRVGDADDGGRPSVDGRRAPASCHRRRARPRWPRAVRRRCPRRPRKRGPPDHARPWPSTVAATPSPATAGTIGGRDREVRARRGHGARWPRRADAPSRARRRRRGPGASSSGGRAVGADDVGDARLALGERAGLVEHDRPDRAEPLERLGVAEEDAVLGALARADHDRGRRGEPEGAGAGDDQDGDRVEERQVERGLGPEGEPGDERQRRERRGRAGTKRPVTTSARRWMGARDPCASARGG